MTELTQGLVLCGVVAAISAYVTTKMIAFRTRRRRHARKEALHEIVSHIWHTNEHNDAVIITRIALKGLETK